MAKERKQINLSEELTRPFIQNERQAKLFHEASVLADRFHTRAAEIDEEGRFPFENFRELKNSSYVSLTVPKNMEAKRFRSMSLSFCRSGSPRAMLPPLYVLGGTLGFYMTSGKGRHGKAPSLNEYAGKLCKTRC